MRDRDNPGFVDAGGWDTHVNQGGAQGQLSGEQVAVQPGKLFQDRDYPVLNEYRAVFAGLFSRLYGLDDKRLAAIFPGVRPRDLKLV